ncbi:MAG: polysaccharide biosynthesis protein [Chloroflexi bacterium]|nr:polysaccharide biosynthesis protein [Chloroflexota bacterium]
MQNSLNPANYERTAARDDARWIRFFDLLICVSAVPVLGPLFLVLALAVKLTSKGPVFYKASRVGRGGSPFALYKFRSMYVGADRQGGLITIHNDPRVTPVGRLLRRLKLDELPQVINIFRGEMSLVGPRPEDPQYVKLYTDEQRQLLAFRPGLTSVASLYYNQEEAFLTGPDWETLYKEQILPHKLALDLAYMRQYTVQSYLSLLFATLVTLFGRPTLLQDLSELRNRHVFALDFLLLLVSPLIALSLRAGWWFPELGQSLVLYTCVALAVKLIIFHKFGLYNRYWRYADIYDLAVTTLAIGLATVVLTLVFVRLYDFLNHWDLAIYRTVPLIDGILTGLAVTGVRLGVRFLYDWGRQHQLVNGSCKVLVVGAGVAGTMVVREIRSNPKLDMVVTAFVDDDPAKIGMRVQGVPVLGSCEQLVRVVEQHQIQRIIIAIPSITRARGQQIDELCKATSAQIYSLPGMYELIAGYKTINPVPMVNVNQLLNREHVVIDKAEVSGSLCGRTVLVTGAGGSIGSELCRQIAQCQPSHIVLLGHGENSIFEVGLELRSTFPALTITQIVADVRNNKRMQQLVEQYRPEIIFHAAAHKHVPLMQASVEEAITNNVLGTQNMLRAAEAYGVERFVLISTDKAINPTSMMGASKRVAELLVQAAARRSGRPYMVVRFGNVLGSRGSVIPIFQRQIAAGGPITITHPEMTRYFMTIPEAVQLVLQASVLGKGSEIFMLDMGEPVRILDLAKGLIQMAGRQDRQEIGIVFSGIRPGEKLQEELFLATEEYKRTKHQKIFVVTESLSVADEKIEEVVTQMIELAHQLRPDGVVAQIEKLIPGCKLPGAAPVLTSRQEVVNDQMEIPDARPHLPINAPLWAHST